MTNATADPGSHLARHWLSWLLGAALLGAVVVATLHVSDGAAFVRLAQQAHPWWLVVAVLLQGGTYWAQGGIWRTVCRAVGDTLSLAGAVELGLAKLFTDQALPSAGLSSSILVAKALERRGLPRGAINAAVLVNIASYHLAYAATLTGALAVLSGRGFTSRLVMTTAVLFLVFSLALSAAVLGLAGARDARVARLARWIPALRTAVAFLAETDVRLVRSASVLVEAIALQTVIVLCDAATLWILILAVGLSASFDSVFAAFMIASLFRTVGILPGGLGTFEATSVLMLRAVGVETAAALSATLLFRGLSFWLPMLPGYWCSHRVLAPAARRR